MKLKNKITKDGILEYSTEIFRYYFQSDFIEGKYYLSPLRKEKGASFNIYMNRRKGYLVYKDWGGTFGNAIDFVMRLNNMEFAKAMIQIVDDLRLPFATSVKEFKEPIKFQRKIISRKISKLLPNLIGTIDNPIYDETDINYWSRMFIPVSYLPYHNIYSINSYIIGNIEIRREINKPIYIFIEIYKSKLYYKLYAPKGNHKNKWKSTMTHVASNIYHNIKKIPKYGNLLIITKSVKDNVILSYLGYNVISGQGEEIPLNAELINKLKKRYKKIILFYDNDFNKEVNYGIIAAQREAKRFNLSYVYINTKYQCTDTGELATKLETLNSLKYIINKTIQYEHKEYYKNNITN